MVKRPAAVLAVDREKPRSTLETLTFAAARTFPEGSRMAPRMSPEVLVAWAKSLTDSSTRQASERQADMNKILYVETFIQPQQSGDEEQRNRMAQLKNEICETNDRPIVAAPQVNSNRCDEVRPKKELAAEDFGVSRWRGRRRVVARKLEAKTMLLGWSLKICSWMDSILELIYFAVLFGDASVFGQL